MLIAIVAVIGTYAANELQITSLLLTKTLIHIKLNLTLIKLVI